MKILRYILPVTFSLLIVTSVGSEDLKAKASSKLSALKDSKINALSNQISENIASSLFLTRLGINVSVLFNLPKAELNSPFLT